MNRSKNYQISFILYTLSVITSISRWENAIKNRGRNSPEASEEQQLVAAVAVAQEIISFLRDVCDFYQDVFIRYVSMLHMSNVLDL